MQASTTTSDEPAGQPADAPDGRALRLTSGDGLSPGACLRQFTLPQLAAREFVGPPGVTRKPFVHPDAVFMMVLVKGRARLLGPPAPVDWPAGDFIVLRGDTAIEVEQALPFLMRGLRLPAQALAQLCPHWTQTERLPLHGHQGAARLLLDLQDRLLAQGQQISARSADAVVQTLACLLADTLQEQLPQVPDGPAASSSERHLRRIRAVVRRHLADPELNVTRVAEAVGLSESHVHRLFAGEQQTLAAWILSQRLQACRDALASPSGAQRSVTDVALCWGFRCPAHFSRSFKRRYGVAPSRLRDGSSA